VADPKQKVEGEEDEEETDRSFLNFNHLQHVRIVLYAEKKKINCEF